MIIQAEKSGDISRWVEDCGASAVGFHLLESDQRILGLGQ